MASPATASATPAMQPARPRRRFGRRLYPALRWLHVYISMISMLLILLFALTGITLNHPEWSFLGAETVETREGELPAEWRGGGGVDWLLVTEHLRAVDGVRGRLEDYRIDDFEGALAFRAPGYAADVFFDPASGGYELMVVRTGAVGLLNDLHTGQNAGPSWRLVIDVSAVFLALLSLTGLGILLFLKKFRVSGLLVMAAGSAIAILLVVAILA